MLSQDIPAYVYLMIFYFDLQCVHHFIMLHLYSSQNSSYLKNCETIYLWYFWTQLFAADKYIYNLPKELFTKKPTHCDTESYQGSADLGEGDHVSDLNYLASVILKKYTIVTKKC